MNGPGPKVDGLLCYGETLLRRSAWLIVIPVLALMAAALGAFVYATAFGVHSAIGIVRAPFPVGHQVGLFLRDIDLFLIGTTLLISAIGLYELFIREITVGLPRWLRMRDLSDLKHRLLEMIVLILAVTFVEVAVDIPPAREILERGGGIAVVVVALTAYLRFVPSRNQPGRQSETDGG